MIWEPRYDLTKLRFTASINLFFFVAVTASTFTLESNTDDDHACIEPSPKAPSHSGNYLGETVLFS